MSKKNFTDLVVGGQYRARNGRVVEIDTHDGSDSHYPFRGGEGLWYARDGAFTNMQKDHEEDLIECLSTRAYQPADDAPTSGRTSVLTEAESIVNGAREGQYGKAEDSFERIARLWNAYLINKGLVAEGALLLNGNDAANLMVLLKLAREQHAHKRDNYVDIAGYAELANRIAEAGALS